MRIFLAGHGGMVGQAMTRQLAGADVELMVRDRAALDLTDQAAVRAFLQAERPDAVILAAARVGGIHANNTYPAAFLYENLMIEANVIHQAFMAGVERLLFLGSSCIYPRAAPQPMAEDALLAGPLEPTNEPYAIAKIAGLKLCESYNRQYGTDFRTVMPTNLYGPGDNFHPTDSHVIPGMMRRFHEARLASQTEVTIWGSGMPRREFLHVDDLAEAALFVFNLDRVILDAHTEPMRRHLNVGTGSDISIRDLASLMAEVTGFEGKLLFDSSRPDGAPRKLLDISRLASLGWKSRTGLREGLQATYAWYRDNATGFAAAAAPST